MARVGDLLQDAFGKWYSTSMHYAVGVIKTKWLVGPRPERLAVKTGTLRNSIEGEVLPDGFLIHTSQAHGIYWERGIPNPRTIVPKKPGGVLAIPVKLGKGTTKKQAKLSGVTKLGGSKGVMFRRKAVIPPQAPRKFMEPGLHEAMPQIKQMGSAILLDALLKGFPNKVV